MTCEELKLEYTAYALGIASEAERSEIEAHLATRCPNCVPGITSALATVSAMSSTVELKDPPKHLRARITGMVQPESSKSMWGILVPWVISAALAAVLVAGLVFGSLPGMRPKPETARLEQALSILNDPLAKDVTFGEARPSKGRVFVSPSRGVVFIAASLPKLDSGKMFELWVIPASGNPIPAGTFQSAADASAVYVSTAPVDGNAAAVAVTVEPEGGSPQPTTTPFIVAPLKS
jgi:anti-sigma-K factor RskA